MTRRTERVGHVIQRELSDYILREISDPKLGFITLSRVEVSTDLGLAKIFVTVLGPESDKQNSLEILNRYAPRMRSRLSKAMATRTVPKIIFVEDKNLEHGFRINELLKEVRDQDKNRELDQDE